MEGLPEATQPVLARASGILADGCFLCLSENEAVSRRHTLLHSQLLLGGCARHRLVSPWPLGVPAMRENRLQWCSAVPTCSCDNAFIAGFASTAWTMFCSTLHPINPASAFRNGRECNRDLSPASPRLQDVPADWQQLHTCTLSQDSDSKN